MIKNNRKSLETPLGEAAVFFDLEEQEIARLKNLRDSPGIFWRELARLAAEECRNHQKPQTRADA